jgi:hypothetical protein
MTSISVPQRLLRRSSALPLRLIDRPRAPYVATVVGLGAIVTILLSGGRVGTVSHTVPLFRWWGLLVSPDTVATPNGSATLVTFAAASVLAACWLVVHRATLTGALGLRGIIPIAAIWSVLLIAGPPLFSGDVYSYVAQSVLQLHGLDPYQWGPSALGPGPILASVDPIWQNTASPYGPLAALVQHSVAWTTRGAPLATLILLRLLMESALIVTAVIAARAVAPGRRAAVISYVLASPLALLQVTSAGHLESLIMLALVVAVLAALRQHWTLAVCAATAAFAIKASALPALAVIGWIHLNQPATTRERLKVMGTDAGAALLSYGALALVVPDNWGWIRALNTPGASVTASAPTTLVFNVLTRVSGNRLHHTHGVLGVIRDLGLVVAVVLCIALVLTYRRRPLADTVGFTLLTVALLAPVVYPWYLLWGVAPLLLVAHRHRTLLAIALTVAPLLAVPGWRWSGLTEVLLVLAAAVLIPLAVRLPAPVEPDAEPERVPAPAS